MSQARREDAQRLFRRLVISDEDLYEALSFADLLLSRQLCDPLVDWNDDGFLNGEDHIILRGLSQSAIVAYSRPFLSSKGAKAAKPVLPERIWKPLYDSDDLALHYELLARRKRAVAHSDADVWEAEVDIFAGRATVVTGPPIRDFDEQELRRLISMIGKLIEELADRIEAHRQLFVPTPPVRST
ncbi:hypothetical protein B1759_05570 [Rubrivirga sp. SAORIC476]|uniref:hypothetical protein n=1 Tax=Rubrivirga sp. SAORIC476 TaxID=1961794 RepID=UPI000BA8F45E|nr:hypothetical protein [Rubrivirga sp. SAORIC476]PAP80840.1 hypothetical protein B1759_05570 [Rubrivirga sp. SAORIC476]